MKQEQFTVDYFIKKFEAIPEDKWTIGTRLNRSGQRCAHGHCYKEGENHDPLIQNDEENSLKLLAEEIGLYGFARINNGIHDKYQQPTPKQRILAALYDIKKMQTPIEKDEVKETIRYVTVEVDKEVKQLTKQQILN